MATYHEPHPFIAKAKPQSYWCLVCGRGANHALHTQTLAGMETVDKERAEALGIAQAEELTKILHSAKADVSDKAGRMERESPLFFGTGDNPTLF